MDQAFNRQFAKRVRCRLNILHMKQNELAEQVGISPITLSRYMKGHRRVPFELVCRMAEVLECTPNDLIYDED